MLQIKTADSETREYGADHVVTEVFLHDLRRWVVADGQWNVIPLREGKPLSALELRLALDNGSALTSATAVPEGHIRDFQAWIDEYLYYFTTQLDSRDFTAWEGQKLALGPLCAKEPDVFQRNYPIANSSYAHSPRAFYPEP